jgi:hypothetical protein
VPEFSTVFSIPPGFSSGVPEKYLNTGCARTFDLQITNQILYQCTTASLLIVVGLIVTGVHDLALFLLPAFMLLQVFLLLSALLLLASMLLSLPMLLLPAGTHALNNVSAVVGSTVAGIIA